MVLRCETAVMTICGGQTQAEMLSVLISICGSGKMILCMKGAFHAPEKEREKRRVDVGLMYHMHSFFKDLF